MKIVVPAYPCWSAVLSRKLYKHIAKTATDFLHKLGYELGFEATEPRLEGQSYIIEVTTTIVEKEDEGEPGGNSANTPHRHSSYEI